MLSRSRRFGSEGEAGSSGDSGLRGKSGASSFSAVSSSSSTWGDNNSLLLSSEGVSENTIQGVASEQGFSSGLSPAPEGWSITACTGSSSLAYGQKLGIKLVQLNSLSDDGHYSHPCAKRAASADVPLSAWPHQSVTDTVGVELGRELITGNRTQLTRSAPAAPCPLRRSEWLLPATQSMTTASSARSEAIDRLASAALRSYESTHTGSHQQGRPSAEGQIASSTHSDLSDSDSCISSEEPGECHRTLSLPEAMQLMGSRTNSINASHSSASEAIYGFMDRHGTLVGLQVAAAGSCGAESEGERLLAAPPLEYPARGQLRLRGIPRREEPESLLSTVLLRDRLDTGASIASLRRAAEEDIPDTPREYQQDEEDGSGLRTPLFCTPSPSPFKQTQQREAQGNPSRPQLDLRGLESAPCDLSAHDEEEEEKEGTAWVARGNMDTRRESEEVAEVEREDSSVRGDAPPSSGIASLSYMAGIERSSVGQWSETEDDVSAPHNSAGSFVFARVSSTIGSGGVPMPVNSNPDRQAPRGGGWSQHRLQYGREVGTVKSNLGMRGGAPGDPQEHSPAAAAAGDSGGGFVPESPGTPRKRSLLGRIGVSAIKAVRGLSPNSSKRKEERRPGTPSVRGHQTPGSEGGCSPVEHAAPRASYTIKVQDWASSEEGSPVRKPDRGAPQVLEWSAASYPPLRPHQGNGAGNGSMGLLAKGSVMAEVRGSQSPGSPSTVAPSASQSNQVPAMEARTAQRAVAKSAQVQVQCSPAKLLGGSQPTIAPSVQKLSLTPKKKAPAQVESETAGGRQTDSEATVPAVVHQTESDRELPPILRLASVDVSEIQPDCGASPQIKAAQAPEGAASTGPQGPKTPDLGAKVRVLHRQTRGGPESQPEAFGDERRFSLDSVGPEEGPGSLGVIVMEDSGNKYEGQIGSHGLEGLGVMLFESGGSYAGRWRDSLYEGCGIETFPTGSHCVGNFHKGRAHGHGVCYYADGSTYAGQWEAGVQHGLGSQDTEQEDGFFYVGAYRNGKRHGLGVAGFANGEEFSGELQHDSPHGYGVAHLGNQKGTYEGQWLKGVRHGWAVSTVSTGAMWAGQWVMGRACWLAQLRTAEEGELADEYLEAMDLCEEAARLARAAGMAALTQAQSIRTPGGKVQVAIHKATKGGVSALRGAHLQRQKAQQACIPTSS